MLDPGQSRRRQQRLLQSMQELKLDAIAVASPQHVYYFTAFLTGWLHQSAFVLFNDGRGWLVTANSAAQNVAADDVVAYEAQWNATLRQEQPAVVGKMIAEVLKSRNAQRVGFDASPVTSQLLRQSNSDFSAIDPLLWQMRRVKDADELSLMKKAILCSQKMYEHARRIIEPGISELRVFGELHSVAVQTVGEPLTTILGNDYQCGTPGGSARDRQTRDGELYILDLGPCFRGYFADNARTIAVGRKATEPQLKTWHSIIEVLSIVEKMAKPGVRCRDIYQAVNEKIHLTHHLGHGVGLQPHEFPHLNEKWDDVLHEGDIFTAEPGIYSEKIAGGIRIENQYLVTKTGVENLTPFPMELC